MRKETSPPRRSCKRFLSVPLSLQQISSLPGLKAEVVWVIVGMKLTSFFDARHGIKYDAKHGTG